jgi:hypothetical protein
MPARLGVQFSITAVLKYVEFGQGIDLKFSKHRGIKTLLKPIKIANLQALRRYLAQKMEDIAKAQRLGSQVDNQRPQ